jgi:DNA repair protein RadC
MDQPSSLVVSIGFASAAFSPDIALMTYYDSQLTNPAHTAAIFHPMLEQCRFEHCIAVHLDAEWHVVSTTHMTSVSSVHAAVSMRKLAQDALACDAVAVVLVHNHPSGIAEPSEADRSLTQTVRQTLHPLGIRLIDHVIIAGPEWISFRDLGLL